MNANLPIVCMYVCMSPLSSMGTLLCKVGRFDHNHFMCGKRKCGVGRVLLYLSFVTTGNGFYL